MPPHRVCGHSFCARSVLCVLAAGMYVLVHVVRWHDREFALSSGALVRKCTKQW